MNSLNFIYHNQEELIDLSKQVSKKASFTNGKIPINALIHLSPISANEESFWTKDGKRSQNPVHNISDVQSGKLIDLTQNSEDEESFHTKGGKRSQNPADERDAPNPIQRPMKKPRIKPIVLKSSRGPQQPTFPDTIFQNIPLKGKPNSERSEYHPLKYIPQNLLTDFRLISPKKASPAPTNKPVPTQVQKTHWHTSSSQKLIIAHIDLITKELINFFPEADKKLFNDLENYIMNRTLGKMSKTLVALKQSEELNPNSYRHLVIALLRLKRTGRNIDKLAFNIQQSKFAKKALQEIMDMDPVMKNEIETILELCCHNYKKALALISQVITSTDQNNFIDEIKYTRRVNLKNLIKKISDLDSDSDEEVTLNYEEQERNLNSLKDNDKEEIVLSANEQEWYLNVLKNCDTEIYLNIEEHNQSLGIFKDPLFGEFYPSQCDDNEYSAMLLDEYLSSFDRPQT